MQPHDAIRRFGTEAVSFQALEPGLTWWRDAAPPDGTGAAVAYVAAGRSWIAVGRPLAPHAVQAEAARRFGLAARARGRRPIFFAVESLEPFPGFRSLQLGRQCVWEPGTWATTLAGSPKLREQLRRARAKGVVARVVDARDIEDNPALRRAISGLAHAWLSSRRMEPMAFLVRVEPFIEPREHVYVLAERHGEPLLFLSAVPIYARGGWLLEDMLRARHAPNGTTELVIDAMMRHVDDRRAPVTPGMTPLSGTPHWWLRAARAVMAPLYDFSGLERFRARLHPARWQPVWMTWDRGAAPFVLLDVLRAFADNRLLGFARRSLLRHPNGPPWLVGVPLLPWTLLIGALAAFDQAALLGFSRPALAGWTMFDAALAWLLFETARRPWPRRLALLSMAAAADAALSVQHLVRAGVGASLVEGVLRGAATAGPVLGTVALGWAWWHARAERRAAPA